MGTDAPLWQLRLYDLNDALIDETQMRCESAGDVLTIYRHRKTVKPNEGFSLFDDRVRRFVIERIEPDGHPARHRP